MSQPVEAPEVAELPQEDITVPPEGSSEQELLTALVAALIAGAFVGTIAAILGRFPGLTRSLVVRMFQDVTFWGQLISTTSTEISLLPRDDVPSVRILHQGATVNAFRRAAFLVNSARRLAPAMSSGDQGRIDRALQAEDRYHLAHERAERKRNEATRIVAEEAADHGTNSRGELLLGWNATLDERTSADCRWAHGRNFNALIRPRIGYPGEVHLDCFPAGVSVLAPPVVASVSRWYSGDLVEITTESGHVLPATPNHPVLTPEGWVAIGQLDVGADVFRNVSGETALLSRYPDEHQQVTRIEEIASALRVADGMTPVSVPMTPEDLHGDGADGQVHVVLPDRLLRDDLKPAEPLYEKGLGRTLTEARLLASEGETLSGQRAAGAPAYGVMSSLGPGGTLLGSAVSGHGEHGFGSPSQMDPRLLEHPSDDSAVDPVVLRQLLDTGAGGVLRDEVVKIRRFPFEGHVYSLDTVEGWFTGNGIVVHNCRCRPRRPWNTRKRVERGRIPEHD